MDAETLWEEFNLGENTADPGGGILYCLRYDSDRINSHREQVIRTLKSYGIELNDVDEGIAAVPDHPMTSNEKMIVYNLLEELSCLNEAQEYNEAGYGRMNSVRGLGSSLILYYFELVKENIVDAYNLIDLAIPELVRDIKIADRQNNVLGPEDRKALEELASFAERHVRMHNRPGGYVIIGS
jgi:hypothetical protein